MLRSVNRSTSRIHKTNARKPKLYKLLPINAIRLNGYSYHSEHDMMHSDKTKSAPHQVIAKIRT
ncbi:hypothetical protein PANT111_160101 [Pantoea brenneri]|uniref:Uncharacterized protein n=1 Tax=Pantoea brenneri TaxID=472694 RepID=A0AAX3J5L7_9GAMM|nr:hypothetical protein PANT111_160101 [Pantoea brenneri]